MGLASIVAALALTARSVPNSKDHSDHPFDIGGPILSAITIGGLVYGIHEGPEQGWSATVTIASLVIGVLALVAFIAWEWHQEEPLLDVRAFVDRGLASGSMTLILLFAVMQGIMLVLFPFFQAVLGWSTLKSAIALRPMELFMMPASVLAPRLVDKVGSRLTMLTGLLIGLGLGCTMTPSTAVITESLPPEKQGVASALNDATRQFGGSLGIALLGAVVTAGYRDAMTTTVEGLPDTIAEPAI